MTFQTNRLKYSFSKTFPEIKTSVVATYWASSLGGSEVASPRLEVKTFSNPFFYSCDKTRGKIRAARFTALSWPPSINCEEQNESIHLLQTHSESNQLTKAAVMKIITVLSRWMAETSVKFPALESYYVPQAVLMYFKKIHIPARQHNPLSFIPYPFSLVGRH